jgi:hypothetical protein
VDQSALQGVGAMHHEEDNHPFELLVAPFLHLIGELFRYLLARQQLQHLLPYNYLAYLNHILEYQGM